MINIEALKVLRQRQKISCRKMAERLGYKNHSTYSRIENGQVDLSIYMIPRIAKALNLPIQIVVSELFFTENGASNSTHKKIAANG